MIQRMVRYTVKPDRVADNEHFIRDVFDALHRAAPPGLRYASFRIDSGESFMHLVAYENDSHALTALPAFQAFVAQIRERCIEPPVTVDLQEIGSYGHG